MKRGVAPAARWRADPSFAYTQNDTSRRIQALLGAATEAGKGPQVADILNQTLLRLIHEFQLGTEFIKHLHPAPKGMARPHGQGRVRSR